MASIRARLSTIPPSQSLSVAGMQVLCDLALNFDIERRNRLSSFWAPTGGITPTASQENDSHALLIRAGFLRQVYSGVFHLLPLGLRVQDKLQNLIDHHMKSIGSAFDLINKICIF